jgi:WD40 repeat protein
MHRVVRAVVVVAGVAVLLASAPGARADKEKELLKTKAFNAWLTPDAKFLVAAGDNVRIINLAKKSSAVLAKATMRVVLSPDGKAMASIANGDKTDTVTVYDVATAKPKSSFPIPSGGNIALALTPDGKLFLHGTLDSLVVRDAAKGDAKHTLKDLGGQPWSLAVSADGKLVACGTDSKKVIVFDADTFKPTRTFEGLPNFIQSVAFTPDGKTLAACSGDVLKVWDLGTGKEVRTIKGTKDKIIRTLAFGNEGKVLVSAGSDATVTVWDAATDKALDTIKAGKDVFRISLSADGKTLAVTTEDDVTRLYDLSAVIGS